MQPRRVGIRSPLLPYTAYKKERAKKKALEEMKKKLRSLHKSQPQPSVKPKSKSQPQPSVKPKSKSPKQKESVGKVLGLDRRPLDDTSRVHLSPKDKKNLAKASALWDALGEAQTKLSIILRRTIELKTWSKTVCEGQALKDASSHSFFAQARALATKTTRTIGKCAIDDFDSIDHVHRCLQPVHDLFEDYRKLDKDYQAFVIKRCKVPTAAYEWQDLEETYKILTEAKKCEGEGVGDKLKRWLAKEDPEIYGKRLVCMGSGHGLKKGTYLKGKEGAKVFMVNGGWVAIGFPAVKLREADEKAVEWQGAKDSVGTVSATLKWLLSLFGKALAWTASLLAAPLVWLGGKIWKFRSALDGWKSWLVIVLLATGTVIAGPMIVALGLESFAWILEGFGLICSFLQGPLFWYAIAFLALLSFVLYKRYGKAKSRWANIFILPLSSACYLATFCTWFTKIYTTFHLVVRPKLLSAVGFLDLFSRRSDLKVGEGTYLTLDELNGAIRNLSDEKALKFLREGGSLSLYKEKDGSFKSFDTSLPLLDLITGKGTNAKLQWSLQTTHPPTIGSAFLMPLHEMDPGGVCTHLEGAPLGDRIPNLDATPSFGNFYNYLGAGSGRQWRDLGATIAYNLTRKPLASYANFLYGLQFVTLGVCIILFFQKRYGLLALLLALEGIIFGWEFLGVLASGEWPGGVFLDFLSRFFEQSTIQDLAKVLREAGKFPIDQLNSFMVIILETIGVADAAKVVADFFQTASSWARPDLVTFGALVKVVTYPLKPLDNKLEEIETQLVDRGGKKWKEVRFWRRTSPRKPKKPRLKKKTKTKGSPKPRRKASPKPKRKASPKPKRKK